MRILIFFFCCFSFLFFACSDDKKTTNNLKDIAINYVKLGLKIGQYDADFVDAYYGPDSLKPTPLKDSVMQKDSLLAEVNTLLTQVDEYLNSADKNDSSIQRATWMRQQLVAFGRRIKISAAKEHPSKKKQKNFLALRFLFILSNILKTSSLNLKRLYREMEIWKSGWKRLITSSSYRKKK